MSMVLLNCLIAIMADACTRVRQALNWSRHISCTAVPSSLRWLAVRKPLQRVCQKYACKDCTALCSVQSHTGSSLHESSHPIFHAMPDQVSENQAARFIAGRAEIIDELEGSLPGWFRRRTMGGCYPRYIHFLKVGRCDIHLSCAS